jgi:hypothetical protein
MKHDLSRPNSPARVRPASPAPILAAAFDSVVLTKLMIARRLPPGGRVAGAAAIRYEPVTKPQQRHRLPRRAAL